MKLKPFQKAVDERILNLQRRIAELKQQLDESNCRFERLLELMYDHPVVTEIASRAGWFPF